MSAQAHDLINIALLHSKYFQNNLTYAAKTRALTLQMLWFAENLINNSHHSYGYHNKDETKPHTFTFISWMRE